MDKIDVSFANFAKEINFPISDNFKDAKLLNTELNDRANLLTFKFACRATLPFAEMHAFLKCVNKKFGAKAKLEFTVKTSIYDLANVKLYIAWILNDYLKESALAMAVEQSHMTIQGPAAELETSDAETNRRVNEISANVMRILQKLGFTDFELKSKLIEPFAPKSITKTHDQPTVETTRTATTLPANESSSRSNFTRFNRNSTSSYFDNMPAIYRPEPTSVLATGTFIVFDLETTGLRPKTDEIIEFGAAKIVNQKVVDQISFFIKPRSPISGIITKITGITNAQVKNGLSEKEALEKIMAYFDNNAIIAHNAGFDVGFLNDKLGKNDMSLLKVPIIDTMICDRLTHPNGDRFRLEDVAKRYNVAQDKTLAHRAGYDVEVLTKIWLLMVLDFEKLGVITQGDLAKFKRKAYE